MIKKIKTIAIILLLTIVLTQGFLYTPTYANNIIKDNHEHIHKITINYHLRNINGGSSGHYDEIGWTGTCNCGDVIDGIARDWYSHTPTRASDWHHLNKHYFVEQCTVCSYEQTISYACSGNPCITPYSIPHIISLEN